MRICFIDLSCCLETVNDLENNPRGGMVSSLFKISDYLSFQGHDIYVVANIKTPATTKYGTHWENKRIEENFDFLICNRGTGDGYTEVNAKHRILWVHDLPHAGFIQNPKTIKAFSATVFMSRYAEAIWRDFYRDIGKSFMIPNGVDKTIFYPRKKDLNYLIFASAPNRGLKRLPFIFDCIESRLNRPIYMRAFSNLGILHPGEVDKEIHNEQEDGFSIIYNQVAKSMVEMRDPIPQKKLAEELGCASLMILPTDYPEICSNIILQSLSSGTPIVTTGSLGSAGEWIRNGWNGFLTKWQPVDYMVYQVDLIRAAIGILENQKQHRRMILRAGQTKILNWEEIGAKWEKMLNRLY